MDYLIYVGILATGFVIYKLDRWLEKERERRADLERRVAALEARPDGSRLTHRDILNVENSQAAALKVYLEAQELADHAKNSLFWLGQIQRVTGDPEEGDDDEPVKSRWP